MKLVLFQDRVGDEVRPGPLTLRGIVDIGEAVQDAAETIAGIVDLLTGESGCWVSEKEGGIWRGGQKSDRETARRRDLGRQASKW